MDRPNNEDFDGRYGAARRFDQNCLMNKAFLTAPIQCIDWDHDMAPAREADTLCTPTPHFVTLQQISKPITVVGSISSKQQASSMPSMLSQNSYSVLEVEHYENNDTIPVIDVRNDSETSPPAPKCLRRPAWE